MRKQQVQFKTDTRDVLEPKLGIHQTPLDAAGAPSTSSCNTYSQECQTCEELAARILNTKDSVRRQTDIQIDKQTHRQIARQTEI